MSLKDHLIKSEYRSLIDDMVRDFYIPCLENAVSYRRAVGFFSSSSLVEVSQGIAKMAQNGGKIRIVASPYLSDEDIEAIKTGYENRKEVIEQALLRQLHEPVNYYASERMNMLANLVADGILDIRIAYTMDRSGMGMYHEKMGIIEDDEGNVIAFSGSNNESATAMSINYETMDVFRNWGDSSEKERVQLKCNAFHSIWNNNEPNIEVMEFENITKALIEKYRRKSTNFNIDKEEYPDGVSAEGERSIDKTTIAPRIPEGFELRDYQVEAIDKWEEQDFKGIFDMATGTGKTYTGLGAAARLSKRLEDRLALIIVCPYQHLVEQWVEDIVLFGMKPIIGYSSSIQRSWKKNLESAIRDQKLKVRKREFFCFVTTNATFSSEFVQNQLSKIRSDILLMVDEAHNFGADNLRRLLLPNYKYRLALSATLDRHGDPEGTEALYRYFGGKCIEYSLEKAIGEGKLTPYKYYPVIVSLSDIELQEYDNLTTQIAKCLTKDKRGKTVLSEKGKRLALQRSRLVAGASGKIQALEKYIMPYIEDKHILVYCGATTVFDGNQENMQIDNDEIRQIDLVTDLLGNKLHMKVSQFTSKENVEERNILKREFADGSNLQALIAIKCLDEGVNIPKIKTAFILASTNNPKEYIQRRGRVLRLAEGKDYAEIYDFITLPRKLDEVTGITEEQMKRELTLVKNELCRAEEFARIALNSVTALAIIDDIRTAYDLQDYIINYEEEFTYGE
ncbi:MULTISPECIES: DEAD/DEAH box helicase family protein [Waltera]|jgi:superfamily II DNA or RNA helicase|uniref:DEAD/DEAH box helicase family protein n=1 Tax=Waltera TaxID=2815781 RepID=UPI0021D09504|nr:DEAD/DEAH box helicase family protein [Brotolimicola acetigignens]MCU6760613.1 DEAD/DEAH box helicase family protein [Brotolimicola acetigignens]